MTNEQLLFIETIGTAARKYYDKYKILPSLVVAMAIKESGWGNSAQGDFNFGNITTGSDWSGRFVQGKDHNASGQRISQKFRSYDSLKDYVKDEIQLLTSLYDFNQNDSFDTFMTKLQGGNRRKRYYAEAPDYIANVRRVYNSI